MKKSVNKRVVTPVSETEKLIAYLSQEPTYSDIRTMPDGQVAYICRFMFTHAVMYAPNAAWPGDRWCYHSYVDAKGALIDWENNFDSMVEPEGWHRHPRTGRRQFEKHCEVYL
jgi:hypothetical protein